MISCNYMYMCIQNFIPYIWKTKSLMNHHQNCLFVLRMEPEAQEEEGEVTLTGEVIGETEAEAASSHLLQTMPDGSQTTFMVYPLPSYFQPLAPLINLMNYKIYKMCSIAQNCLGSSLFCKFPNNCVTENSVLLLIHDSGRRGSECYQHKWWEPGRLHQQPAQAELWELRKNVSVSHLEKLINMLIVIMLITWHCN